MVSKNQLRFNKKPDPKKLYGLVLPFPISNCSQPDPEGVIYRAIFPCAGELIHAVVALDGTVTNPVELEAEIRTEALTVVRELSTNKPMETLKLEAPVEMGTRLRVIQKSADPGVVVWVGLLFLPAIADPLVRRIILEAYEQEEPGEPE